ncbi:hscarg dehydrogenase [Aspergillus eucalypticola CBS 122712]|uniref:Hscarg dehydrogenase n=1 Tax=Aspergillus eucalypticola (strain CBS 122712 / IBT 29274) TaxID=1448314 RepID=A0A317USD1_ASPEC|nr:hscarg dehydrogenase [Aspergillus eucalypticola CBS 122712]PWY64176.1 hscarg dehydrogenase [Aspergillus eucalypticola CBS 122712]
MSPQIFTILPATSQQGLSIISAITDHPTLRNEYTLRALVRNPSSPTTQSLTKQSIEVLSADLNNPDTLTSVLTNTHTLILITLTDYSAPDLKHQELTQVQNVISACPSSIKHIIFSSAVSAQPHGREVDVFDSKFAAEEALRTLTSSHGIKVSVFYPGMFIQNFETFMRPLPDPEGKADLVVYNVMDGGKKIPLIDAVRDLGKFVVPILTEETERVYAANGAWSFEEVVDIMGRVMGKKVRYVRMEEEVYAGFMPGQKGWQVVDMLRFYQEVGYYGGDEEGKVRETLGLVEGVRGFEEFVGEKLVKLE